MPNSFSKLYIHYVTAVKYRKGLILPSYEVQLYKYIAGIIEGMGQTVIAINGMPDHIHIAARLKTNIMPCTFAKKVKGCSSKWINEKDFLPVKFAWQVGGGSFSISKGHVERVQRYIQNQKRHHYSISFKEEYLQLLNENDIEYKDEYLPEFFEGIY